MTLPEIAVILEEKSKQLPAALTGEMSDEEYARYWSSLTPTQRLEKVAESKRST